MYPTKIITLLIHREIKQCVRSLFIYRLRTLLSTLGILFGVVAIISMLSIGEGAKQEVFEQIEQLGMNNILIRQPHTSENQHIQKRTEKNSQGLTWKDLEALRQHLPSLIDDAPLTVIEAPLNSSLLPLSPEILATTRSFGQMKELQLAEGRFLCDLDQQRQRLVCVLGYEVAKHLGQEGHIGSTVKLNHAHYEIVGVLKSTYWKASKNQVITTRNLDQAIFIPLTSKSIFSEIILHIQDVQKIGITTQLVKQILARLHKGDEDYHIVIPQELLEQAYRTQHTFNWVLGSIAAISLLVGGIGIMNIMLATVHERTYEIGIRRAIGANKHHILLQFLLEALLLTLMGAILGVVLGITISIGISHIAQWKTVITPWSIVLSLTMSSTVGLCAGLYPAHQAANMDPVQALRG